jgi:hypothetical protein
LLILYRKIQFLIRERKMVTSKSSLHRTALLALSLGLVIPIGFPVLAQAQMLNQRGLARSKASTEETHSSSARRYSSVVSQARAIRFPAVGTPRRREGAAVRGGCDFTNEKPIALLPATEPVLTAAEYPTFFVDLPQTSATEAELLLLSSNKEQIVYETTVTLPGKSGIVSFSLPADGTLPPLEEGKSYYWQLSILCGSQDQEEYMLVEGPVQRVELNPNLVDELKKAPLREHPAIYAEAGIWYDTITSLAQLRRSSPNDSTIVADWAELLKSVGLDAVAQKPLIP